MFLSVVTWFHRFRGKGSCILYEIGMCISTVYLIGSTNTNIFDIKIFNFGRYVRTKIMGRSRLLFIIISVVERRR